MNYVELSEGGLMNRGTLVPLKDLRIIKREHEAHISSFIHTDEFKNHIEATGAVAQYNGGVWSKTVYFDFDNKENVAIAWREAYSFVNSLVNLYKIPVDNIYVYFSGSKGFHVGLDARYLGITDIINFEVPYKLKAFAILLAKKFNLNCLDFQIYHPTALIRMPFSKHPKTGLYKSLLSKELFFGEGYEKFTYKPDETKIIEAIKAYAVDPIIEAKSPTEKPVVVDELYEMYEKAVPDLPEYKIPAGAKAEALKRQEQWKNKNQSIFVVPTQNRNQEIFRQSIRLFSSDLHTQECFDLIDIIFELTALKTNNGKKGDLSWREVNIAAKEAFKRIRGGVSASASKITTLEGYIEEVFDEVLAMNFVPTFVKDFNDDLGGGLNYQNIYAWIGKDGTQKSLMAMNVALDESEKHNTISLYWNMEMGKSELFKRACQRYFRQDLIEEIRSGRLTRSDIPSLVESVSKKVRGKFRIIDGVNYKSEDFLAQIKKVEDSSGVKVSIGIVDSYNSMMQKGSEAETALHNTKMLKEVAKEGNAVIIFLCHATQACPYHVRDVGLFVRGGAKIKDNADGYFMNSLIINEEESNFDCDPFDLKYYQDKIYLRFKNKRGTGNVMDKVMKLQAETLTYRTDTNKPSSFEINLRKYQKQSNSW